MSRGRRSSKKPALRGSKDPSIEENLRWFSRLSPAEKIYLVERHKKVYRLLKGMKVPAIGA